MDFTGTGINGHGVTNHPFGDDRRLVTPTRPATTSLAKPDKAKVVRLSDVPRRRAGMDLAERPARPQAFVVCRRPRKRQEPCQYRHRRSANDAGRFVAHGKQIDTPGDVVMLNNEDDASTTIGPRVDAAGGDSRRVHLVQSVEMTDRKGKYNERSFNLGSDLALLREVIERVPNPRLVSFDTLSNYFPPDTNTYKDSEVRQVLMPLVTFAQDMRVAVLGICHLTKATGPQAV